MNAIPTAAARIDSAAISSRAMLVRLTIRQWGGKSLDRTVTAEVARQHNVSQDAGRYNKVLVSRAAFEPITKAISALRAYHYEQTLPWQDEGARVLPSAGFFSYRGQIGLLKDDFDRAVAGFLTAWPDVIAEAKVRLGSMFRDADYPSDVGRMFNARVAFLPFPDASDFRVDLAREVADSLRNQIAQDVSAASQTAISDCYRRIADVVGHMTVKLKSYRINPETDKVEGAFRDSLVENVRDLALLLPKLNFAQDPELDRLARLLAENLCQHDADVLRNHEATRLETISAADAILAQMSGYLGEPA